MSHSHRTARSYANLVAARKSAIERNKYSSEETRQRLTQLVRDRFHNDPYAWQLDVAEALVLGLDCVVIAGTGAGTTMPFMMPLLLDHEKTILIISPLKVLQADM
ncbi:hypothetical protein H0H92_009901, partial [Tricholoma furcatifolium]